MLKKSANPLMMLAIVILTGLLITSFPQAAYSAGMSEAAAGRNVEEPPAAHEGFDGSDGPPPPRPGREGMMPGKGGRPDFMKNLTPEQRDEAKNFMMLGKSYNDLADVYVEEGKVDEAIAVLKKLAAMKLPSYIPADHLKDKKKMVAMKIVQVYLKAGKDAEALAEAESLVKGGELGTEEQAHLYSMMGNAYKKRGDKVKAAEMLKKTIDLLEKNIKK
jgi:pentatricopeptide repeat protein